MFSLIVSVQVRPEQREAFLSAIAANAEASVREEPGCLRFDVVEQCDEQNRFWFYEIYTDRAAFDDHRAAPHFAAWREAAAATLVPGSQRNIDTDLLHTHSA